ncbi:hypothetical protein [Leifsonia xyli]|uniref:hypothetical protein n=1 Tax=Leifsonia xyli TaxID=1575 RepID=UPI0012FDE7A4
MRINVEARSVPALCLAYLPLMPQEAVFSHQTAAELLGIPLPTDVTGSPLHVSVPFPRTPPGGRGVIGHSLGSLVGGTVGGLPVCSPEQVWCQLSTAISPLDLVAAGDHLVGARSREPRTDVGRLAAAVDQCRGSRGTRARAWALPRIRFGTDSRPETLLRLLLEELGFSDLEVNSPVVLDHGRLTLHPDLSIRESRLAFEYEGDGHREKRQWGVDIRRQEHFEVAGWLVVRVTADDLFHNRDGLIARLAPFVTNRAHSARTSAIRDES